MTVKKVFLCVFLFLIFSISAIGQNSNFKAIFIKAQQENKEVVVTLSDGNTFSGFVESIDEESAGVTTKNGLFNFRYDKISNVKIVDSANRTSKWYANPASNKLFVTQSGRMLEKGSGYYQNTYIFISSFTYGLFQNLSINAGFSTFPGLGFDNQFYTIGVKAGVNLNENISISGTFRNYQFPDFSESASTFFGAATYSNQELDLTGGIGIGLNDEGSSDPVFILGGQLRVSQRIALVSENLILPDGTGSIYTLGSFGVRFINPKTAIDLGFFTGEDIGAIIPFASFLIKL